MNNAHSSGDTWQIPAPAAVTSGIPFIYGSSLVVPVTSAAPGELVAVKPRGAFAIKKLSTAVIAGGAKLHWDTSAGEFIVAASASGDLENCAVAVVAAGSGEATVVADLLPGVGAIKA
jgi:predicted RecA/RadA family phage recombinase